MAVYFGPLSTGEFCRHIIFCKTFFLHPMQVICTFVTRALASGDLSYMVPLRVKIWVSATNKHIKFIRMVNLVVFSAECDVIALHHFMILKKKYWH